MRCKKCGEWTSKESKHNCVLKGWASKEWREKNPERTKRAFENERKRMKGKIARSMGMKSKYYENIGDKQMVGKYGKIYRAESVCDRICLDKGELVFVEIKQKGQKLRTQQQEFKEACKKLGIRYEIEYVDRPVA